MIVSKKYLVKNNLTLNVNVYIIPIMIENNSKKATITTLAQETGLSLATVSRALAGLPSVLPETRNKVLEAAERFNYVKDRAGLRLKTGRTQVLAFIMNQYDAQNPGFQNLIYGLGDSVQGTDYHLIVLPETAAHGGISQVKYVVERGLADGIAITHTSPHDKRVEYLLAKGFPFITHGRTLLTPEHGFVDFANEQFAAMSVQALASRGRKKTALLLPKQGGTFRQHLIDGFTETAQLNGVVGHCIDQISLDDEPELIYQWALENVHHYDSFVVTRESPVIAIVSAIQDAGLEIGKDLDLVIKYSSSLPFYLRQPMMACFEDLRLAGKTLGQSMLAHFARPGISQAKVLFPPPPLEFFHANQ